MGCEAIFETSVDLRGSGPSGAALGECILVECRKLHGPRWCRVNQNRLGPEIRPLLADVATQETTPIGHFVLLGVSRGESPDVSIDSRCDRSMAERVRGGVDGCQDNTGCGSCDANQLRPTRFPVGVRATLQRIVGPQILDYGMGVKFQRRFKRWQALVDANAVYRQNRDVIVPIEQLMYRRRGEDRDRVPVKHHARLARPRAAAGQEHDRECQQPSHKVGSVILESPQADPKVAGCAIAIRQVEPA